MIRQTTLLDINAVYDLAVEAWSKAPYSHIELDDMRLREYIRSHIKHESMSLFVSEIDGEVVGFIGASLERMAMSKSLVAHSTALYVRSGGEGLKLIERYVKWAKNLEAVLIGLDQTYAEREMTTSTMFAKAGFVRVGGLHYHSDAL